MVKEAEEHAAEDRLSREKVEARNQLESYLYNLRFTISDSLKDKISANEKQVLSSALADALTWLENHPISNVGDKKLFDDKRREMESIANPILSKTYDSANSNGVNVGAEGEVGPTVEETSS